MASGRAARSRRQLDAKVQELAWRYPDDWPVSPKATHATPVGAEPVPDAG